MKKFFLTASVIASLMGSLTMWSCSNSADSSVSEYLATSGDTYVFDMSDAVTREHVSFKNRYGFTIAADLYLPKNIDKNAKNIAIIMGAPYGGVKEQCAGLYAMEIAKRGYVALAFDHSFNGASSGTPRYTGSSDIFAEDYSAAVDYLGSLPYVDRNKIGAIGLGSSACFAMHAASVDKRIKALISVNMIDMDRICRVGMYDKEISDAARYEKLKGLSELRWNDVDSGHVNLTDPIGAALDSVPAGFEPLAADLFSYYGTKRGWHARAKGCFAKSSMGSFRGFISVGDVFPTPLWFLVSEKSAARYMTEDIYNSCRDPKGIRVVTGATHVDLYDRTDIIPFDEFIGYFKGM